MKFDVGGIPLRVDALILTPCVVCSRTTPRGVVEEIDAASLVPAPSDVMAMTRTSLLRRGRVPAAAETLGSPPSLRRRWLRWGATTAFLFFLIKGLLWLAIPTGIAVWSRMQNDAKQSEVQDAQ